MEHIEHTLAGGFPNIKKLTASFTTHFQKQRYEMVAIALEQLLPLRELCETELVHVDDIFKDFQDRELLVDVRAASAWAELWIFLESFNCLLARPIEKIEAMGNGMSLLLGAATRYEASVEVSAGLETPRGIEGFRRSAARNNCEWLQR